MRTRRTYFKDYQLNDIQVTWLKGFCRLPENRVLLEEAAKAANPAVAEYIVTGLVNDWDYRQLTDAL